MLNELIETVVRRYLSEIGENKFNIIARELSISPKEAQSIGDIIKGLEPKPGRGFADNGDIKYIMPDVVIEKVSGHYMVIVNERSSPRLTINSYYRDILKNGSKDEETKDYIKKKLDSAAWLIKSIEQRRTTIYNVVNAIVSLQEDFLDKGIDYLKPLTLKEVAEDIGVHESTVSRAISGKYVQTPRGLFPLKFFFTRGLDAAYGDNVSSESIKKSIRDIVNSEDAAKPLSDQKITDILNREGISISRRTVAKYREEMGILPTSKRKRY
jgi:RNA polymerase sigma-54 factor